MLDSIAVSQLTGMSERTIRRRARAAVESGESHIKFKDLDLVFVVTRSAGIGGDGWVYSYTQIQQAPARSKKKVKLNSVIDIATLPVVANLTKPTTDEKLALVSFYNSSKHPLSAIVKALIMQNLADIKPSALQTRIKRWTKAYEKGGRAALVETWW